MKKIFLLTVSLLFAFTTIYAERVSQEDAALVANHFMSATVQTGVKKASGSKMVLKKAASAEEPINGSCSADGGIYQLFSEKDMYYAEGATEPYR